MISPRGHVILRDDPAVTSERSNAELLRSQLYARVGRAQLTELLLTVDGETHFSGSYFVERRLRPRNSCRCTLPYSSRQWVWILPMWPS